MSKGTHTTDDLEKISKNDQAATARLYERYAGRNQRIIETKLKPAARTAIDTEHLAHEVIQEVLAETILTKNTNSHRFRSKNKMVRDARLIDALRRVTTKMRSCDRDTSGVDLNQVARPQDNRQSAFLIDVESYLAKQQESDRRILVMKYFESRTYGEIAINLGLSTRTVERRHSRMLDELHELLGDEDAFSPSEQSE